MEQERLGLLFLGRLETEKGFDLIFDFMNNYPGEQLPFEIYIFGSGSYEKSLLQLSYRFKQIHYFGWKPLSEVERYIDNIDYCLMPSKFLETFGLSAVNVLKWGIPVVGFKKGGLIPFVFDEYDILQCSGNSDSLKFSEMIFKLEGEKSSKSSEFYRELSEKCKNIAGGYNKEKWFENFQLLISGSKVRKVIMVSDFINKIGGIETYIHDVKKLLESKGYEVVLFGNTCPKGKLGRRKRLVGIMLGNFNLFEAVRFKLFVEKENPDLIWYHSMIRWMGRFPLWSTRKLKVKKRMMYHDFGYFTSYPHQLFSTDGLEKLNLKDYIKGAHTKNPLKLFLVIGKYFSTLLLLRQLRQQIDLHLTPSEFMVPIVATSFGIAKDKIKAFNHFLQE